MQLFTIWSTNSFNQQSKMVMLRNEWKNILKIPGFEPETSVNSILVKNIFIEKVLYSDKSFSWLWTATVRRICSANTRRSAFTGISRIDHDFVKCSRVIKLNLKLSYLSFEFFRQPQVTIRTPTQARMSRQWGHEIQATQISKISRSITTWGVLD